jgi:hypothetical protein
MHNAFVKFGHKGILMPFLPARATLSSCPRRSGIPDESYAGVRQTQQRRQPGKRLATYGLLLQRGVVTAADVMTSEHEPMGGDKPSAACLIGRGLDTTPDRRVIRAAFVRGRRDDRVGHIRSMLRATSVRHVAGGSYPIFQWFYRCADEYRRHHERT